MDDRRTPVTHTTMWLTLSTTCPGELKNRKKFVLKLLYIFLIFGESAKYKWYYVLGIFQSFEIRFVDLFHLAEVKCKKKTKKHLNLFRFLELFPLFFGLLLLFIR